MYNITDWLKRYEVNYRGEALKEGEKVRSTPLRYIRLKVNGYKQGTGFRRLKQKAKGKTMEVFGIFCKLLELSADQNFETRGQLLSEKGTPADAKDLSFIFDIPESQISNALNILSSPDVGWITDDYVTLRNVTDDSERVREPLLTYTDTYTDTYNKGDSVTVRNVTESDDVLKIFYQAFKKINPSDYRDSGVDFDLEYSKMKNWIIANPQKVKKNWKRFIVNWLNSAAKEKANQVQKQKADPKYKSPARNKSCPICKKRIPAWQSACPDCLDLYAQKIKNRSPTLRKIT